MNENEKTFSANVFLLLKTEKALNKLKAMNTIVMSVSADFHSAVYFNLFCSYIEIV